MPHLGGRHYQPLHTVLSEVWVLILSLTQIQQIMLLTAGSFPTRSASFLTVTSAYFLEEKNNWHTNPHDSRSLSGSTRSLCLNTLWSLSTPGLKCSDGTRHSARLSFSHFKYEGRHEISLLSEPSILIWILLFLLSRTNPELREKHEKGWVDTGPFLRLSL